MTLRAKPAAKRPRSSREQQSHRTLYINIAFGLVVVAALGLLVLAAGATWYSDHLGSVATVNGVTVSRDDYRTRYKIEEWRYAQAESLLRDQYQKGRITQAERDSGINAIEQQLQSISSVVLERLVDAQLQSTLASTQGITVSQAEIDQRLTDEATTKEQRHIWAIEFAPEVSSGATAPTDAQVAAAQAKADQALADMNSGKSWDDVAKAAAASATTGSTSQTGDLGWYTSGSTSVDPALLTAMFKLQANQSTGVIKGADGTFRIGRVTEIAPAEVDQTYQQKITDAGISLADYRKVVASDVTRQKLSDAITASVVDVATPQRRVSQIFIAASGGTGDQVRVRHILISPNGITDTTKLAALPSSDPAWAKAKADAQAIYDELKPYVGTPALETKFAELAQTKSNDTGTASSGGELPYFTQDQVDRGFGDAIFSPSLKAGDLVGPVLSQYGYHVILFEDRRPDPYARITNAKIAVDGGQDFASVAKTASEGAEASKGGDLGWIARLQLDKKLEDAIFNTPVGKTSDIVDGTSVDSSGNVGGGWYLFKVVDEQTRKPDGDQLTQLKANAFTNWYTAQKDAAAIDRSSNLPTVTQ